MATEHVLNGLVEQVTAMSAAIGNLAQQMQQQQQLQQQQMQHQYQQQQQQQQPLGGAPQEHTGGQGSGEGGSSKGGKLAKAKSGRPERFSGKREDWDDFSFCLGNWASGEFPNAREYLRKAAMHEQEISPENKGEDHDNFFWTHCDDDDDHDEANMRNFSNQLYRELANLVGPDAVWVVKKTSRRTGVWRRGGCLPSTTTRKEGTARTTTCTASFTRQKGQ